MKHEQIFGFLKLEGFECIKEETSEYFSDCYVLFSNGAIIFRFTRSRNSEAIDVCSSLDNENWYDLALVKALLFEEKILNRPITIEEYISFLFQEFIKIKELFSAVKFYGTKEELRKLEKVRMHQMFPDIS